MMFGKLSKWRLCQETIYSKRNNYVGAVFFFLLYQKWVMFLRFMCINCDSFLLCLKMLSFLLPICLMTKMSRQLFEIQGLKSMFV